MQNLEGDWKEQEKAIEEWKKCRKAEKEWLDGLCEVYAKTEKAAAKVFTSTPEFDCHFIDSPLSPSKHLHDVRSYLCKKEFPLERGYAHKMDDLNQDLDAAIKWATKLNKSKK